MTSSTASFSEIRALVAELPPLDPSMWGEGDRFPVGEEGASLATAAWVAAVQRRPAPRADHLRAVLFAASHGIAADLPDGAAAAVARQVQDLIAGDGDVARLAEAVDCELKLHELAIERPTRDSRRFPAMDEAGTVRAAAYGMMAVEPGVDAVAIAQTGSAPGFAAVALGLALLPEAGMPGPREAAAIARHRGTSGPLELLAVLGGPDIAAMLGVILASRLAGIPVILDGAAARAAAAVAWRLRPDAIGHCRFARSRPPSQLDLLRILPIGAQLSHAPAPPLGGIAALESLREACG